MTFLRRQRIAFTHLKLPHILIGTYLLVAFVFLPLLTPLRQLEDATPGLIRAAIIPPIVLLITLLMWRNLTKFSSVMMPVLFIVFLQAALVGLSNVLEDNSRNYLSHLFQLFSAYVMFVCGTAWFNSLGLKFWKFFSLAALLSVSVSSFFSISLWMNEEIGRLYTPAYIMIFVSAVSLAMQPKGKLYGFAAILVTVVSNKRGPLLSVLTMFAVFVISRFALLEKGRFKVRKNSILNAIVIILFVIGLILLAASSEVDNHPFKQAFNKTTERVLILFASDQDQDTLNATTSGRIEEINLALNSLSGTEFILGAGAGWTEVTASGKEIQNVHFTPVTLTVVYGLPFAAFLYAYVSWLIVSMLTWLLRNGTHTEKIALFYVIGSLIHTMAAYSLFIDLLNFFFIGVLARAKTRRKRLQYKIVNAGMKR